ncbi:fungal-specific transcription factor domain-containing protein [Rhexocercosporidium sp. MPI-PUGE-AT-0058]|nr:fungal-specific transcription factor domain-containing protein [Rhexocercosporidium sp. MPI-PUGE-AT-0058]
MGIKGCWTCRKRKVRCDSQMPKCGNCTKARRFCQGYGIQLSWPRGGDKKRAILSRDTGSAVRSNIKEFLNSSSWDVSLSEELEDRGISTRFLRTMKVPGPIYLSPTSIDSDQSQLLGFWPVIVNESRSLILGPTDEKVLTQFILRVAFSDPSDEANPVLQGVFALASLQLHGSLKSFHYKHRVVTSISEPTDRIDEKTLLQYLIAMMLLYHHELSLESNSKGSWVVFLCTVKRIINTSPTVQKLAREEYSVFLDWIYYHETLAEFTVRHWKVPYEGCGFSPIARSRRATEGSDSKVENNIGCPIDVLQLLVHACRLAIAPIYPEVNYPNAGIESMGDLEERISRAVGAYGPIHVQSATSLDRKDMVSDLHRLACLLYANRAIHRVSGSEFHHRRLVREGILLLTKMVTCQHAWPLFVIACEAVDDVQRLAILEVFEQSRQNRRRRSSHVHFTQHLVEAVWNQHDLNVEKQVDYLTILDAVIGGVPFIPLFA